MSSNDSQVTTLDDAPAIASAPVKTTAKPLTAKAPAKAAPAADAPDTPDADSDAAEPEIKMFNVTVHATNDASGNEVVDIQPNGRLYRLPRGVPCLVPEEVLHILENAVTTSYAVVGAAIVERNIPRFPFSATPA